MENLINPHPIYNFHNTQKVMTKKKLLYNYEISEKKKSLNNIRDNDFNKLDSISKILLPEPNLLEKKKNEENFPLIYIIKNNTKIYSRNESHNLTNNKYLTETNKSIKKLINSTLLSNKNFKIVKLHNINKRNNKTITKSLIDKMISKKFSVNFSKPKKSGKDFNILLEKIDKSPVKMVKLKKINLYNEKILDEPIKDDIVKENQELVSNPIKISKNVENNNSNNDKKSIGPKYTNFDLSPDSISKNLYYSRLNTYSKTVTQKKPINIKKINLKKFNLQNNKLKVFHFKRMKECRKLMDDTIKEVNGLKDNYLNWVNELKEKYANKYGKYEFNNIEVNA